jgi:hypothetical protein
LQPNIGEDAVAALRAPGASLDFALNLRAEGLKKAGETYGIR